MQFRNLKTPTSSNYYHTITLIHIDTVPDTTIFIHISRDSEAFSNPVRPGSKTTKIILYIYFL